MWAMQPAYDDHKDSKTLASRQSPLSDVVQIRFFTIDIGLNFYWIEI